LHKTRGMLWPAEQLSVTEGWLFRWFRLLSTVENINAIGSGLVLATGMLLWHDAWRSEWCSHRKRPLLGNDSVIWFSRQRIRKQQQRNCWKRCFLFGPWKVVIKKRRQSSSRVASKQLIESWALRGRLRWWRYELSWHSGCEEILRVLLYSVIWSV
jgi:hypothetical protein